MMGLVVHFIALTSPISSIGLNKRLFAEVMALKPLADSVYSS